jgi:hypothetical protein
MQILPVTLEVHDWVADQLPEPVKGHISAALDLEQLYPFAFEKCRRSNEMLLL